MSRLIRRWRKGGDGGGVFGQRRTTGGREKKSKKLDLGDRKLAFWKHACQAMLPTEDKNLWDVIHMKREILGEDKNVILVHKAEWKITQKLIQKTLQRVLEA